MKVEELDVTVEGGGLGKRKLGGWGGVGAESTRDSGGVRSLLAHARERE